jgi:hypothetical protein
MYRQVLLLGSIWTLIFQKLLNIMRGIIKKSNKKYVHLQTILTKMIITHSYKWDTPKVQQQQPKLLQLTLIQAAGELYKIK